jgi:ABC-type multidrug transport system ATPase subunit
MPPYISIGGYADPPLLPYLSVEVEKGELVALKGPPGSGKSNLIKSMAGIRTFLKGTIKILGSRPDDGRYLKDSVFVFQSDNYVPDLPLRMQLERKIALYRGVPVGSVRSDVNKWSMNMELEGCIDDRPERINRSDLGMLSLAPVALTDAAVVILDEPLAPLSSLAVSAAVEIILSKLEGAAVLAVCGTRSPLLGRADRVVSLR